MSKRKIGKNCSIDDSKLIAMVERVIRESAKSVIGPMEDTANKIVSDAKEMWPVKTGKSKAGLTVITRLSGTAVEVVITDPVPYTYLIKGLTTSGKNTWNELIAKPSKKAGKQLGNELSSELIALAKRGK